MFDNSILFYGYGTVPVHNYVGATLINGRVRVSINFGDGEKSVEVGRNLNSGHWRNLTIHHTKRTVDVIVDGHDDLKATLEWPEGHMHHLHINPEVLIGGTTSSDKLLPGT